MSLTEASESEYIGEERRSSVRAKAWVPFSMEVVARESIEQVESRILDASLVDEDQANLGTEDWLEKRDEMPKEYVFMLRELRALRQQLATVREEVEGLRGRQVLASRWVVFNDRGLWIPSDGNAVEVAESDFVRIDMRIPSISSPNIMALGEVLRVREGDKGGVALEFRSISELHSQSILRYAIRRERQLARNQLFSSLNL